MKGGRNRKTGKKLRKAKKKKKNNPPVSAGGFDAEKTSRSRGKLLFMDHNLLRL